MLTHPQFDPVAFHIGPLGSLGTLGVHWYGVMYLLAFVCFLLLGRWRIRQGFYPGWKPEELDDLLLYGVFGVILGGHLGYVFFYKPDYYLSHPAEIFKVWDGGMAFHGGFLGLLLAALAFARKSGRKFLQITDFIAPLAPIGLVFARLGNFIQGELWGRVTSAEAFWAMRFPGAIHADQRAAAQNPELASLLSHYEGLPRHAAQLYLLTLEGLLLGLLLWWYSSAPRQRGQVSALFLVGYGVARFVGEFAREPDEFLGLLAWNFTMGQWLSIPMILLGAHLWWWKSRQEA